MLPDGKSYCPSLALTSTAVSLPSSTSPRQQLERVPVFCLVWKREVPAVKLRMGLTEAEPLLLHRAWTYMDNNNERNLHKTL